MEVRDKIEIIRKRLAENIRKLENNEIDAKTANKETRLCAKELKQLSRYLTSIGK